MSNVRNRLALIAAFTLTAVGVFLTAASPPAADAQAFQRIEQYRETAAQIRIDGKAEDLLPDGLPFMSLNDPRLSRDGRQLLLTVEGSAIYMVDLDTQTPTLMSESGFYPLWSPDGSEIIYSTTRAESFDIYRRPVDLSREEKLFMDVENNLRTMDWTRQGQLVEIGRAHV